jgi:hypothetical protein
MAPAMEMARVIPAWAPWSMAAESAAAFPVSMALRILTSTIPVHIKLMITVDPSLEHPMGGNNETCMENEVIILSFS